MPKDVDSVLITGGNGFLGRHLVEKLSSTPVKIVVVDRAGDRDYCLTRPKRLEGTWKAKGKANVLHFDEDVRNEGKISEIIKKERIRSCIHLAGLASVRDSFEKPHEVLDINVNGTLSLLNACTRNNVKSFIFASSSAVYGDSDSLPLVEDAVLRPISVYGASKVAGEALVCAYSTSMNITFCLRFFNIYGNKSAQRYPAVIQEFKKRLEKGLPLVIHGDGKQTRDFIHVDDAAKYILLANDIAFNPPKKLRKSYLVLNVGSGKPVSIKHLAKQMQKSIPRKPNAIIFSDSIPGDIKHSYADTRKSEMILKYRAQISLREGLLSVMKWNDKKKKGLPE